MCSPRSHFVSSCLVLPCLVLYFLALSVVRRSRKKHIFTRGLKIVHGKAFISLKPLKAALERVVVVVDTLIGNSKIKLWRAVYAPGDGQTSPAYSSHSVQCLYINHLLSVNM
jgi:hypothetical protein